MSNSRVVEVVVVPIPKSTVKHSLSDTSIIMCWFWKNLNVEKYLLLNTRNINTQSINKKVLNKIILTSLSPHISGDPLPEGEWIWKVSTTQFYRYIIIKLLYLR